MMLNILRKLTPSPILGLYHYSLAGIGALIYGFPSKKLKVIGVTGTSGKSTVVDLADRILSEGGHKVASLSSISFKIGKEERENKLKMTMPGRMQIQKFLRNALDKGCEYVILEVTSEGIKQNRHKFINFDTAVFTNLSPEHIEAHGGFDKYKQAKLKLFDTTKNIHIINADDKNASAFFKKEAKHQYLFGIEGQQAINKNSGTKTIKARKVVVSQEGIQFEVKGVPFSLKLFGEFNVYNALSAISIGLSKGVPLEVCKRALENAEGIAGRMEIIVKEPFAVVVDYAHTPVALEKVYKAVKKSLSPFLVCVLGSCGGGRDKWKRPVLGKIAREHCKEIIITNEDPYEEDPQKIIDDVAKGTKGEAKIILDRREAIRAAFKLARPGDAVIITGKGSEPWMCVEKGEKIPWDDRDIAREELQKL